MASSTPVDLPPSSVVTHQLRNAINDRLAAQMLAKGYKRYDGSKGYRFANLETKKYPNPPPGFITGPINASLGNPLPRQFNVMGFNGWLSRNFKNDAEGELWAVQRAQEILLECERNT